MPHLPYIFIEDFSYELAMHQIAEHPEKNRDASKLLIYKDGIITDAIFYNLDAHLPSHSTLVLNNSKVLAARLRFPKASGGVIEIFCLQPHQLTISEAMSASNKVEWECLIGGASKWKAGVVLQKKINLDNAEVNLEARFVKKDVEHFVISFTWDSEHLFADVLEKSGAIPLPPYIKRAPNSTDPERYQTVFAEKDGSVAAPTAALHFTPRVFQKLGDSGINHHFVTLHVGAGTFKPMKALTAAEHQMHSEPFSVTIETLDALTTGNTIIAVGTTTLRTLESLYWLALKLENGDSGFELGQWEAYTVVDKRYTYSEALRIIVDYLKNQGLKELHCRTALMILPGYSFKSASALITNFHQPRSTLLLLITAFIGEDWRKVYTHALENNYRFLSYGDSSLLWRKA